MAVGMHAATEARIRPGDVVLVLGAGPYGLVTALSALAAGCVRVYMTDGHGAKLKIAATLVPITPLNIARVMANELGRHCIRVNAISPTVTLPPMAVKAWSDETKAAGMLNRIPLGHFATPEQVGEVVQFLLTDASAMLNGLAMPVDGGFMSV